MQTPKIKLKRGMEHKFMGTEGEWAEHVNMKETSKTE
jgi:hypothetical protein